MTDLANLVLLIALAGAAAGCGQETSPPAPATDAAVDMLKIRFGFPHEQFLRDDSQIPPFGIHFIGAPVVSGPLEGIFHDFVAEVDHSENRVIGASAERTMASLASCQQHHAVLAGALRSAFPAEGVSGGGENNLGYTSGDLGVKLTCLFHANSRHPTLSLSIRHQRLVSDANEAWEAHLDGKRTRHGPEQAATP